MCFQIPFFFHKPAAHQEPLEASLDVRPHPVLWLPPVWFLYFSTYLQFFSSQSVRPSGGFLDTIKLVQTFFAFSPPQAQNVFDFLQLFRLFPFIFSWKYFFVVGNLGSLYFFAQDSTYLTFSEEKKYVPKKQSHWLRHSSGQRTTEFPKPNPWLLSIDIVYLSVFLGVLI